MQDTPTRIDMGHQTDRMNRIDHAVTTAYALSPETIATQLERAGFDLIDVAVRGPLEGERALGHATVLARAADTDLSRR